MKKWIRWPGLAAFMGVVALLFVFFSMFAGKIIQFGIEKAGTSTVGAKVELDDVDLSFSPLGVSLIGLKVTNPDEPLQNAIEILQANLSLDPLNLFRRKVVIDEMTIDGVTFNTPRNVSGAIDVSQKTPEKKQSKPEGQKEWDIPSLEVTDIKDILAREKLETVEAVKKFQNDIEKEKQVFENKLKELPDEATFRDYEKRVKELKDVSGFKNILKAAKDVESIKKDFDDDIKKLKDAQVYFQKTRDDFSTRVKEISGLPAEDYRRIKSKYTLTPQGMGNLTHLIFGPQYSKWVENGLIWYQKLAPMLQNNENDTNAPEHQKPERGRGVNVTFKEHRPVPDFLIHHTSISLNTADGEVSGSIKNITNNQRLLGSPTTWEFSGKRLKETKALSLNGEFNHIVPDNAKDTFSAKIKGHPVRGLTLSKSKSFPLTLQSAVSDVELDAVIKGKKLDSRMDFKFNAVTFQNAEEKDGTFAKPVRETLSGVERFSVTADVKGTVDSQDIKLKSDLDMLIRKALSDGLQKQTAAFDAKLKEGITNETQPLLTPLHKNLTGLDQIEKKLTDRLKVGQAFSKKLSI